MNATAGDVPTLNLAIGADAGDPLAAVLDAAAAAGVVWHERNEYEAKGAPCPVCGGGGRDRLRVRHGDEGVTVACSGCGSGAEFWRRFTRVIGFRWTARRPSREARRAAQVAGLVRSTSARTLAGAEGPTRLAWTYGLDGWRWEGGDEIKAAGEVLRPAARSYLSQRIGGWPASRPWPAAIREVPQPGLRKWQGVTGRYWPVELSCIGVLLFGFFAPGEAEPGALQAEAYTRDGRRVPHRGNGENVRRWTLGKTEGRVFQVAPAFKSPVGVAICEGPTAALAIAAVRPRVLVLAVGGGLASSILHVGGHLPRGLPVRLYGERGAHAAARSAGEDLAALGYDVGRPWLPPFDAPSGCDFADYRAERARGKTA